MQNKNGKPEISASPVCEATNVSDGRRAPKRFFPISLLIIYAMTLLTGGVYLLLRRIPRFADWLNGTVSAFLRRILAYVANIFPFSLAETLLIALPLLLVLLVYIGIRYRSRTLRDTVTYCGSILAIICILFQMCVFVFSPGYYGQPLDERLGLDRKNVSAEELYDTACVLIEAVNRESSDLLYRANGFSVMPYTVYRMSALLLEAYDTVSAEYDAVKNFSSFAKPVALSEGMSYTHITGVYTFFTGEANINVAFPDYTLPYTAAHELAHQRGFAREDEANFVAFLVCMASEDDYIRYSGYVGMYEYVMNALYRADKDLYSEALKKLEAPIREEQIAYREFFKKYQDSTVGEVSGAINNSYLQSQGTVGSQSYGIVVDLTVAYFKALSEGGK